MHVKFNVTDVPAWIDEHASWFLGGVATGGDLSWLGAQRQSGGSRDLLREGAGCSSARLHAVPPSRPPAPLPVRARTDPGGLPAQDRLISGRRVDGFGETIGL